MGNLMVISPDTIKSEEICLSKDNEWGGYGARWLDMGDGNTYVSAARIP